MWTSAMRYDDFSPGDRVACYSGIYHQVVTGTISAEGNPLPGNIMVRFDDEWPACRFDLGVPVGKLKKVRAREN